MLKKRNKIIYYITIALFVMYVLFLVWIILFKLELSLSGLGTIRAYNLIPFHYEDGHNVRFHFSEVINNILIFIPVGVYLSLLLKKISHCIKIVFIFGISLALECSQFILSVGRFNITDLITNTIGGLFGIGFYLIGCTLFFDKEKADRYIAVVVNTVTVLLICGTLLLLLLN